MTAIVIPARFASSRFPGKPLAQLGDKPMIAHVIDKALAANLGEVIVATDDERIAAVATACGVQAVMTPPECPNGTARIASVAQQLGWSDDKVVINVQGDEPFMPQALIRQVGELLLADGHADISTLAVALYGADAQWHNPNQVKVVTDANGYALYFSRANIPFDRDAQRTAEDAMLRHLGIYAYKVSFLRQYAQSQVCRLEQLEQLEQLRALYMGARIKVGIASETPPTGVDTPEDLAALQQLLHQA